jgi:hypothetical protein
MAGALSFKIQLFGKNLDQFPELQGRVQNLQPVFERIIDDWAKGNVDKFGASKGKETMGAMVDPGVFWLGLKPETSRRKRQMEQPDQIMVATGELRAALTNPEGFFRAARAQDATFGVPLSPEDEAKIFYNWGVDGEKRQTIFLGADDQVMIEHHVQAYLSMGPDFEEKIFSKGLSNVRMMKEASQMDMEFGEIVSYDNSDMGGE